MIKRRPARVARGAQPGQTSVEFTMALLVFLTLVFGMVDVSRAVYTKHGLSRASAYVAHKMALQYSADPASFDATQQAQILVNAQSASNVGFNTAALKTYDASACDPNKCNEWWNGSIGGSTVYVCGVIDLTSPYTATPYYDMFQVTVQMPFKPASSLFIGGRTLTLSETTTALTSSGETASSDQSSSYYSGICPGH